MNVETVTAHTNDNGSDALPWPYDGKPAGYDHHRGRRRPLAVSRAAAVR